MVQKTASHTLITSIQKSQRIPFAYFTQITYYAFLKKDTKEKKQLDTKYKYIQNLDMQSIIDGEEGQGGSAEFIEYMKKQIDEAEKTQCSIRRAR